MHGNPDRDYQLSALCLGLGAIVLGVALYLSNGFYNVRALQLITLVYLLCVAAVVFRRFDQIEAVARGLAPFVLAAGLAFQFYRLSADAAYVWPVAALVIAVVAAL